MLHVTGKRPKEKKNDKVSSKSHQGEIKNFARGGVVDNGETFFPFVCA